MPFGTIESVVILGVFAVSTMLWGRPALKKFLKLLYGSQNVADEAKFEVEQEKKALAEKKAQA